MEGPGVASDIPPDTNQSDRRMTRVRRCDKFVGVALDDDPINLVQCSITRRCRRPTARVSEQLDGECCGQSIRPNWRGGNGDHGEDTSISRERDHAYADPLPNNKPVAIWCCYGSN